jgi:hypothetical protein
VVGSKERIMNLMVEAPTHVKSAVAHLKKILLLAAAVVEEVQASTQQGKGRKWNVAFSPVQVGIAGSSIVCKPQRAVYVNPMEERAHWA